MEPSWNPRGTWLRPQSFQPLGKNSNWLCLFAPLARQQHLHLLQRALPGWVPAAIRAQLPAGPHRCGGSRGGGRAGQTVGGASRLQKPLGFDKATGCTPILQISPEVGSESPSGPRKWLRFSAFGFLSYTARKVSVNGTYGLPKGVLGASMLVWGRSEITFGFVSFSEGTPQQKVVSLWFLKHRSKKGSLEKDTPVPSSPVWLD